MTRQLSVIWVGNPFFHPALAALGWRVCWINPKIDEVYGWDALVAEAGFTPDLVVAADKSLPPFVLGMETFPCLTAFYAVDSHIHSWFPLYAQGFDLCLVSLRDHIPAFWGKRLKKETVLWSPPYASPGDTPAGPDPEKPVWDVLFVGTVSPDINPDRCAFLNAVAERVPGLHIQSGPYRSLFRQAKIVLNHAAANDLNFRVFEALGCGVCLVTPLVRHGLEDLFQNGEDLFTFDQSDIDGLARLLRVLLSAPSRCEKAAEHGHQTVLAGHYMHHRAESLAARVAGLFLSGNAGEMIRDRLRNAKQTHATYLKLIYLHHAETAESPAQEMAYLKAAKT